MVKVELATTQMKAEVLKNKRKLQNAPEEELSNLYLRGSKTKEQLQHEQNIRLLMREVGVEDSLALNENGRLYRIDEDGDWHSQGQNGQQHHSSTPRRPRANPYQRQNSRRQNSRTPTGDIKVVNTKKLQTFKPALIEKAQSSNATQDQTTTQVKILVTLSYWHKSGSSSTDRGVSVQPGYVKYQPKIGSNP